MLCAAPYKLGVSEFGCMKCLPCLRYRKSLWAARLMLEKLLHESSSFVTLTYDEEHLPCDGCVSVKDAQLFLKRLRQRMVPAKLRYFIVGEYGDVTRRPHYHAVLFGCVDQKMLTESWGLGHCHMGELTVQSAAYVVSYTVKGMTTVADQRLKGLRPEFARMSLRPGIGAGAMEVLADALFTKHGSQWITRAGDVPAVLRQDGHIAPLGRYLRGRLREAYGMEKGQPLAAAEILAFEEYRALVASGGREARESKRVQVNRRAKVLHGISLSKRGIGL